MTVGVCLSPWISSRNKICFILGLFDGNDSGALDREQYLSLWKAWFLGMGKAFGVKPPHADDFKNAVRATYARLSIKASARLRKLAATDVTHKNAIIEAIKKKQSGQSISDSTSGATRPEQVVPISTLQEVMMADPSGAEPAFLMQNFAMLRFCSDRWASLGQGFVEDFETLTYKTPVRIPKEPERVHSEDLPDRAEVVVVRDCCQEMGGSSIPEIERAMGTSTMIKMTDTKFQGKLMTALLEMDTAIRLQGGYLKVLQAMYPRALPRHFKLFEQWCNEYDKLSQQESRTSDARGALLGYRRNSRKPIIPASELERIKREYQSLKGADLGAVPFDVIARYFDTSAREIVTKHDLDFDNHVSLREFCRMMCPANYRLPEMDGVGRELFGKILELADQEEQKQLEHRRTLFQRTDSEEDILEVTTFSAMCEPVPADLLLQWHAVFDDLDRDADEKIRLSDLVISGCLSEPVSKYVVQYLGPDLQDAFTRDAFIQALLRAYHLRKPVSMQGETPHARTIGKNLQASFAFA
eukprot:TRINITY_DN21926_c0_g1_i1.p1 TRINITY_DN21926_c0_g1~~TRINITY_DN21926_c0_g1_i1.p1  ORF type:complete len:527 (+),score=87.61 TRINITY_DN21926_c0_g1_i1:166-1746(+)